MSTNAEIPGDWPAQLTAGLAALRLSLADDQLAAMLGYLGLLMKWNRAYNLSAVRDPAVVVRRHLLDSLAILPWVGAGPVLDVGTGAGLPGMALAIAIPDLEFSLLDSNRKKTRFVQQAVGELGLRNVEVIHGRVEQLGRPQHYACLVARAFSTLAELVEATAGLLMPGGRCLAMKGAEPHAELAALSSSVAHEVIRLEVPDEAGQRHLVVMRPTNPA